MADETIPAPPARNDKAHDLDSLQRAVNDSARDVSLLWSSFTLLGAYLAITTGSVSHRDLFLDKPFLLPVLSVQLPVGGFFTVAPLLYVISHGYLLLQLIRMVTKLSAWQRELHEAVPLAEDRRLLIMRLTDFPFLQFLAGRGEEASPLLRFSLITISWITLTLFPAVVLLLMQLTFLPDHVAHITWLHRGVIVAEFVLAWTFWISMHWRDRVGRLELTLFVPGVMLTITILAFAVFLATYPGERIHENWIKSGANAIARLFVERKADGSNDEPLSAWLFDGTVDDATGRSSSLFANRLILPGAHFGDGTELSLRGRDLSFAILQNADLRNADFRGAKLRNADLMQARLDGALFDCPGKLVTIGGATQSSGDRPDSARAGDHGSATADTAGDAPAEVPSGPQTVFLPIDPAACAKLLVGTNFSGARAHGASFHAMDVRSADLTNADFSGASFAGAILRGMSLTGVTLQNADFKQADLRGTQLVKAQLQGAGFAEARLIGANLSGALLQGAVLDKANLSAASLSYARLEGASFVSAILPGATLADAQAQGADFSNADLTAANFFKTQLQGADLEAATLDHASFAGSNLYRAQLGQPRDGAQFLFPAFDAKYPSLADAVTGTSDPAKLDVMGYAALLARASDGIADEATRNHVLAALSGLDPGTGAPAATPPDKAWRGLIPTPEKDVAALVDSRVAKLGELACNPANALYVARGFIENGQIKALQEENGAKLIAQLGAAACAGAAGLTQTDRADLKNIFAPPPAATTDKDAAGAKH